MKEKPTGKKWNSLTEGEKSRIVTSILNKEMTLRMAAKKYDIGRRTVTKWVNESKIKELFNNPEVLAENPLNLRMNNEEAGADLNKKCKALMDALQREKLKNEALLIMIELAEEKFKIKIRKKLVADSANLATKIPRRKSGYTLFNV